MSKDKTPIYLIKIKNMWQKTMFGALLGSLLTFFRPVIDLVIVLLVIFAVDTITGIVVSRKKQVPITSRRLRDAVGKLLAYLTVILMVFLIEWACKSDMGILYFVAGFIYSIEGLSVLENLYIIFPSKSIGRLLRLIRGKIGKTYEDVVENILDEKNNKE